MINKTKKLLLILILIIPVIFLSGCDDVDWDLLEDAFEAWAEQNDLLENGEWKPEGVVVKAIDDTVADLTNQEEFIQLDGLDVIRDIERADELANEAMIIMDENRMVEAIDLRPNDWRLREQMGVLRTSDTERYIGADQFDTSTELIKQQIERGADCISLRKQQMAYRESLLSDALKNCDEIFECNTTYLAQELEFVQERLDDLNAGNGTAFCIEYQ